MAANAQVAGSFRDPNGFVFVSEGAIFRQVNQSYQKNYDLLLSSGLYDELVGLRLLIQHSESEHRLQNDDQVYKVLLPQQIPFISYPYEWSFSQLKDAALTTLKIQKLALNHDMVLKDASAYNVQYFDGGPLLIDTLSFEAYHEGRPWVAYRQFCEHFLAPLLLMSLKDVRLNQLLRIHIDGIPLDLAASLLPKRTYLNLGILMHLHLHARAQRRYADSSAAPTLLNRKRLDKRALINICDSLRSAIEGLTWDHGHTTWTHYYEGDSYEKEGMIDKHEIVSEFIDIVDPGCIWDMGANTGTFSRLASGRGVLTVSIDSDPGVVEANYLRTKQEQDKYLYPLLVDLANPSAAIGWANNERETLVERCKADCILALALIHHLAISNNVPLSRIADYFATLAQWLIIEFVPKTDKKVQTLLSSREDIFQEYKQSSFERIFGKSFEFVRSRSIANSDRVLYLLRRKRS